MHQQINNQLNCSHMIRLSDRPGAVSPQAKLWVLCCMLLCVVARGRIEGENNAQPAWCGRPLRRLSPSQRALDAARRRVLTYDAKHVTQAVTNRSTLVEANMIYRSLPDPLEALATITLHTHKSRHDITYFELGCGEGHMMLELKAIFPCIRAIGLNAAWHCEIGGLACANRREDILDAAKFFGVDGINEHATRVENVPPNPRGGLWIITILPSRVTRPERLCGSEHNISQAQHAACRARRRARWV